MIQPNPVKQKLKRGERSYGAMAFEFFTPGLAASLQVGGCEWVIFDMEHSGAGIDTIKQQIAYARGLQIVPLVRVPGKAYHLIATVMDAGAWGIMVPMMETKEEAEKVAGACLYRPDGFRGLAFGMAHDDYEPGDIVEKMRRLNERTMVIALIETAKGIANAADIIGVPGIDVGWLGHFDLTNDMGISGQFEHPDFIAAAESLAGACQQHGKAAGISDGNPAYLKRMMAMGYRAIGFGTDTSLMQLGLRTAAERVRDA